MPMPPKPPPPLLPLVVDFLAVLVLAVLLPDEPADALEVVAVFFVATPFSPRGLAEPARLAYLYLPYRPCPEPGNFPDVDLAFDCDLVKVVKREAEDRLVHIGTRGLERLP